MHTQTLESEAFWSAQRENHAAWLELYLESAAADYRLPLIDALRPYLPLGRLFDVGCHCGPNLKRLRNAFGPFPYVGLDLNGSAISYGQHVARRDGYGDDVQWFYGSILDKSMAGWKDREFDVVLSSSVLAHIGPDEMPEALATMCRLANRLVVLQETTEERHDGPFHQWAHDYATAFEGLPFAVTVENGVLVAVRS